MIRDLLFDASPYADFDPSPHPDDLHGWGSDDPILTDAIKSIRPSVVCEVGSWKGRSAINMARAAKELNLATEIVCVDTWLGSPEHWLDRERSTSYDSLRIRHGLPQLYYTFLSNVVRAGLEDFITPLPTTSDNAAAILRHFGIKFDLVYIDAAHDYDGAKRDIAAYYDLLADNGALIGDDYIFWDGPTKAANDFAKQNHIPMIGRPGKFLMPKGTFKAAITF